MNPYPPLWMKKKKKKIHENSTASHSQLNLPLLLLLCLSLKLLLRLALRFALQLIRPTNSNVLGAEVAEQVLQNSLNQPATGVVEDHQHGQRDLELGAERHQTQLLVHLRHELGSAGEGHAGCGDKTPVHGLVLADGLTEGTALVVDRKGGNLLDQLEQVDGAVQKRWLEFTLQVDVILPPVKFVSKIHESLSAENVRFDLVDVVGEVDQSHNVNGELSKNRSNDIDVEDVGLRSLLGQALNRLNSLASK